VVPDCPQPLTAADGFHCSNAVNDWWSIAMWANGRHSWLIMTTTTYNYVYAL